MSTLIPAAGRPPLAYSLPGFHSDAYRDAPKWLEQMRELGFQWVTLHPTFPVTDDLRIGPGPSVSEAVAEARRLGMSIRLEPHLDYATSLARGPYRWRRDMLIQPTAEYFDVVLEPMAALQPDELTVGSELDLSAHAYPEEWASAAERVHASGSLIGHKLNHDWRENGSFLARRKLRSYLRTLDYVAISFYPARGWDLAPEYTIGEFGLGSTDVSRPWHFDAATFRAEEDFAVRREYYLRFLDWLAARTGGRAASFWTAGHFDVLGIMHPAWRDDAVVEAVRAYNQASP